MKSRLPFDPYALALERAGAFRRTLGLVGGKSPVLKTITQEFSGWVRMPAVSCVRATPNDFDGVVTHQITI